MARAAAANPESPAGEVEELEVPAPTFRPSEPPPAAKTSPPRRSQPAAEENPQATASRPEGPTSSGSTDSVSGGDAPGGPSGSTGSTRPPRLDKAAAEGFTRVATALLQAAGGLLNERFSIAASMGHESDEWLPDEQDEKTIAPPLGRIAARHAPLPEGANASDISDAIEAIIGAAFYAIKNLGKRIMIRKVLRRRGPVQAPPPADEPEPEPAGTSSAPEPPTAAVNPALLGDPFGAG